MDPSFGEAFVVPCQGPRDAVVLGVYGGVGIGGGGAAGSVHVDDNTLVGETEKHAAVERNWLPYDAGFNLGPRGVRSLSWLLRSYSVIFSSLVVNLSCMLL